MLTRFAIGFVMADLSLSLPLGNFLNLILNLAHCAIFAMALSIRVYRDRQKTLPSTSIENTIHSRVRSIQVQIP